MKRKMKETLNKTLLNYIISLEESKNDIEKILGSLVINGLENNLNKHQIDGLIFNFIENLDLDVDESIDANKYYLIENIVFSLLKTQEQDEL